MTDDDLKQTTHRLAKLLSEGQISRPRFDSEVRIALKAATSSNLARAASTTDEGDEAEFAREALKRL